VLILGSRAVTIAHTKKQALVCDVADVNRDSRVGRVERGTRRMKLLLTNLVEVVLSNGSIGRSKIVRCIVSKNRGEGNELCRLAMRYRYSFRRLGRGSLLG
jgi:hypothetical protein